jgi:hypothetical protein
MREDSGKKKPRTAGSKSAFSGPPERDRAKHVILVQKLNQNRHKIKFPVVWSSRNLKKSEKQKSWFFPGRLPLLSLKKKIRKID